MAISAEQRTSRAGKLGSSDAPRIMAGRWVEVWREKTGRKRPPDLDFVPAVQIGIATEPLHARFYTQKTGIRCIPAGARTFVHARHDFVVAHLDFLTWQEPGIQDDEDTADTILEAKFHAGIKSDEELAEQYYWQIQHQLLVAERPCAVLSILRPSSYSFIHVPRNDGDEATLLETLRAFWWHIENDREPSDPLSVEPRPFEQLRVVDMALHNEFASFSGILLDHRVGMQAFREAEAALKALMPDDACVAFLHGEASGARRPGGSEQPQSGLFLTRSRDGRLTLRFGNLPKKYLRRSEPWLPTSYRDAAD